MPETTTLGQPTAIPGRFSGRRVVVTGGAAGIGRACVDRFIDEGAEVVILDHNGEAGERVLAEIRARGKDARFVALDLSDSAATEAAAKALDSELGAIHVLVNSAGLVHVDGRQSNPFVERGLAGWDPLTTVNLKAIAILVHGMLPALTAGRASIINISSEAAFKARSDRWIYDMTKAGLLSMTRSMAAALVSRGIRVNAVAPGGTITEMHLNDSPDPEAKRAEMEKQKTASLLGRLARPHEIAAAITFLASDDASFITATTLQVDGGLQRLG
ncbi:SDR family NAD(P)-dependent oxidoreductase [Devosia geojensis]|uniref:SDR family NAD(P)-dependent oxidoreductase n=1 Tax=Devosia geojensis TaxID=443610 RepID=UPI0009FD2D36|nr:SDR family oxidoreductase [Devosia geojensis]